MSKKRRSVKENESPVEVKKDESPYIFQKEKLKNPVKIHYRYKDTEKLEIIKETAMDKSSKLIMIDGFWGTGKTTVSVGASLELLNMKAVDGIVYIRNPLEATSSAKIGTLPGTLLEKMAPYNAILHDKLSEFLDKGDADRLIAEGRVEFFPIGLIQGKTFSCKAIIIDEAASMSHDDLLLAVSRVGERCKVFVIGDSTFQLTLGQKSGFKRFFETFNDEESMENGVFTFELKEEKDVLRSGLLRFIMKKCGVLKTALPESTQPDSMFQ
jgi:phosphate starvation-inducible PhoH-like protein